MQPENTPFFFRKNLAFCLTRCLFHKKTENMVGECEKGKKEKKRVYNARVMMAFSFLRIQC